MIFKKPLKAAFSVSFFGFTSLLTQIIILRTFFSAFSGNELSFGMVLSVWMILNGAGALATRLKLFSRLSFRPYFFLLLAVLPLLTYFLILFLFPILSDPGIIPPVSILLLLACITLFPFCFFSGFAFPLIVKSLNKKDSASFTYGWESLGFVLGTLLLFVLLRNYVSDIVILQVSAVLNILFFIWISSNLFFSIALSVSLLIALFVLPVDDLAYKLMNKRFPSQQIILSRDDEKAKLIVTRNADQYQVYNDGHLVYGGPDVVYTEEAVHIPMSAVVDSAEILFIGALLNPVKHEFAKYPQTHVLAMDNDPFLLHLAELFFPADTFFRYDDSDPVSFLRKSRRSFDAIILNMGDPMNAGQNRYFTYDFIELAYSHLKDDGVFSVCLSSSGNYFDKEEYAMHSTLWTSLNKIFSNVRFVPAGKDYFLASENEMSQGIIEAIERREIENVYLNSYYFDDAMLESRSGQTVGSFDSDLEMNTNTHPLGYYYGIKAWMDKAGLKSWSLGLVLIVFLLLILIPSSSPSTGIFAAGFSCATLEIAVIVLFQTTYGTIYFAASWIIALIMLGIGLGSLLRKHLLPKAVPAHQIYAQLLFLLIIILYSLSVYTGNLFSLHSTLWMIIFFFLAFSAAFLTGWIFSLSVFFYRGPKFKASSVVYFYDLAGAALGALVVSVFLIPLLGLLKLGLILVFIHIAVLLRIWISNRKLI